MKFHQITLDLGLQMNSFRVLIQNDLLQTLTTGWSRFLFSATNVHLLKSPSVRIPLIVPFLLTTITNPDLL